MIERTAVFFVVSVLVASAAAALVADEKKEAAPGLGPEYRDVLRSGDVDRLRQALDAGARVDARDATGNTPLLLASLYARADCVKLLLERGADVNGSNRTRTTPLMLAAGDVEKVSLLLDRGADPKASSVLGNTPLIVAARYAPSASAVRLLLDRGADVNAANRFGVTALTVAASTGDNDTLRLLLDRGAKADAAPSSSLQDFIPSGGRTPLMWAASCDNLAAVDLLLERGAKMETSLMLGSAISVAAQLDRTRVVRRLLDRGAKVNDRSGYSGFTPLIWAASTETGDPSLVELLIEHGADVNATGGRSVGAFMTQGQTPLMQALRRGRGPIAEALEKAGATSRPDLWSRRRPGAPGRKLPSGALPAKSLVDAIGAAVPHLERSAIAAYRDASARQQNCVSCHNQYLPLLALAAVRQKGLPRDEDAAATIRGFIQNGSETLSPFSTEATFHPAPGHSVGYEFLALAAEGRAPTPGTDEQVHLLSASQLLDGRWMNHFPRPPINTSDVGATALAIAALGTYPLPGRAVEIQDRIARARRWLESVKPRNHAEQVFQLLGLSWGGADGATVSRLAKALVAKQRQDGGWSQLPALASDAYATGLSLHALHQTGALDTGGGTFQKGLRYLLRSQLADGTWFVRRRAYPFQPTMRSGFSHGRDAWISTAATSWAVIALAAAVDGEPAEEGVAVARSPSTRQPVASPALPPVATRAVDFDADIEPLLERSCAGCHRSSRPQSGYRMDSRDAFVRGGSHGEAAVIPGDSAASPLVHFVAGAEVDVEMPPLLRRERYPALSRDEIGLLRAWIDQGAVWSAP